MTAHVRRKVIAESRIPTIRECTLFLLTNGIIKRKARQYAIKSRRMESAVKHAILEKAVKAPIAEETLLILSSYEELLVKTISDDPLLLFGAVRKEVNSFTILEAQLGELMSKVKCKNIFTPIELDHLEIKLLQILEGAQFQYALHLILKAQSLIKMSLERGVSLFKTEKVVAFLICDPKVFLLKFRRRKGAFTNRALGELLDTLLTHYFDPIKLQFPKSYREIKAALEEVIQNCEEPDHQMIQAYVGEGGRLSRDAIIAMDKVAHVEVTEDAMEQQEAAQQLLNCQQGTLKLPEKSQVQEDIPWATRFDPHDVSHWFQVMEPQSVSNFYRMPLFSIAPPLFQLSKGLRLAEEEETRNFASMLSNELFASWNMFKVFNVSSKKAAQNPFGGHQKPILEVLLLQRAEEQKVIIIDQSEAELWRVKLKKAREESKTQGSIFQANEVKIALLDVATGIIAATGPNPINEDELNRPLLKEILVQLKVISGQMSYTTEERERLKNWASKQNPSALLSFLHEIILKKEHFKESFDGSDLQKILLSLLSKPSPLRYIKI